MKRREGDTGEDFFDWFFYDGHRTEEDRRADGEAGLFLFRCLLGVAALVGLAVGFLALVAWCLRG